MQRDDEFNPDERKPSKSQLKRDSIALQDLGKKMIGMRPDLIKKLPISEEVQKSLLAAKTMKMGALKRQIQYIGKLLRQEDDLTELHRTLADYFK